jgi:hypothetical protein
MKTGWWCRLAFPKPRSEEFEASRKQDGAAWLS